MGQDFHLEKSGQIDEKSFQILQRLFLPLDGGSLN